MKRVSLIRLISDMLKEKLSLEEIQIIHRELNMGIHMNVLAQAVDRALESKSIEQEENSA